MAVVVQRKNAASHNWIPHLQDGLFTFDTPNLKHTTVSIQPNCGNDAYLFRIKYMPLSAIWLMNVFNAGSRVSFYDSTGRLVNGTVQSITRTSDGAQSVLIKRDNGGTLTLPSASVFQA
ncbi:hypothetical protein ARMGADRAFT_1090514 [Armillaria gallica]|uniref:Uncharacterized protein n=1 Tax=Armillaria gallica TaxID=47427 RepID=A0A2H3CZV6_ARMGA|nr:hypothetical protein ARMGADRAFT_1090514 [Armillaria gallica]